MNRCRKRNGPLQGMTTFGLLAAKATFKHFIVAEGETCFIRGILEIDEELKRRPGPKRELKCVREGCECYKYNAGEINAGRTDADNPEAEKSAPSV